MKKEIFQVKDLIINTTTAAAGFPSPAENYIEENLDLNKYLVKNFESTFFIRVLGDSMIDVGIYNNDILVVDKSLSPINYSIVIASLNGELIIKKFLKDKSGNCYLKSENKKYPIIKLKSDIETIIWGVARYVIHSL
ncbi:MAG: LexA family protein [Alphaproteobacteria bacterium]